MLSRHQTRTAAADLGERIRAAADVTPRLLADVIAQSGIRMPAPVSPDAGRLRRLIEAEAWTDVALALVEVGLPQWSVVRLVVDGGEWHCALSRYRHLPDWLDDAVEAHHAFLPLAILAAFADACQAAAPVRLRSVPRVQQRQNEGIDPICCDNFC